MVESTKSAQSLEEKHAAEMRLASQRQKKLKRQREKLLEQQKEKEADQVGIWCCLMIMYVQVDVRHVHAADAVADDTFCS